MVISAANSSTLNSEMVAWTTDLKDGRPLADISISANGESAIQKSDSDGVTRFSLPNKKLI